MMALHRMLPMVADVAVKGALLVLVAAVLFVLLRPRSAAVRHGIWISLLASQLLMPFVAVLGPTWRAPILPRVERSVAVPELPLASPNIGAPALGARASAPSPRIVALWSDLVTMSRHLTTARLAGTVWGIGLLLVLLHLGAGWVGLWRLAGRAAPVVDDEWLALTQRIGTRLGVARPVTLLRGHALAVPVTWGIRRPVILLPDSAETWSSDRRESVLLHEMAHVARLDALTQLLGQVAIAAFWFSPAIWYAALQARREREHACDDAVLAVGTPASRYADDLLAIARGLTLQRTQPAFAALAMARRSAFEQRMRAILAAHPERRPLTRRGVALVSVVALSCSLTLATLRFLPREAVTPQVRAMPANSVLARELAGALGQAGDDVEPTRRVIREFVARHALHGASFAPIFTEAVASIADDHARFLVLTAMLGDRGSSAPLQLAGLQLTARLASDYKRGALLRTLADSANLPPDLEDAFFAVAKGIGDPVELRNALEGAIPLAASRPRLAEQIVTATAALGTGKDLESVLGAMIDHGIVGPSIRPAFDQALSRLPSDAARRRLRSRLSTP